MKKARKEVSLDPVLSDTWYFVWERASGQHEVFIIDETDTNGPINRTSAKSLGHILRMRGGPDIPPNPQGAKGSQCLSPGEFLARYEEISNGDTGQ